MKKGFFLSSPPPARTKTTLVALVGVLALFGGGYSVYSLFLPKAPNVVHTPQDNKERLQATVVTVTPSQHQAVQTALSTSYQGWKSSQKDTYDLKYPGDWYNAQDTGAYEDSNSIVLSNEKAKSPSDLSAQGIYFSSSITPVAGSELYNQMFNSNLGKVTLTGSFDPNESYTKIENIQIDSYPAVIYTDDYSNNAQGHLNLDYVYAVKKGDQYYSFDFSLNKSQLSNYSGEIQLIINSLNITN